MKFPREKEQSFFVLRDLVVGGPWFQAEIASDPRRTSLEGTGQSTISTFNRKPRNLRELRDARGRKRAAVADHSSCRMLQVIGYECSLFLMLIFKYASISECQITNMSDD